MGISIVLRCPCCRHYQEIKRHTSYETQNHGERMLYN